MSNLPPFDAAAEQVTPHGSGTPIVDLVKLDLETRAVAGEPKYRERLKANNGRDALLDAYQEGLDLVMYLRQLIEERRLAEARQLETSKDNLCHS